MIDKRDTVVGVFRDQDTASHAIEALQDDGFALEDVSVLAPQAGDITGTAPDSDADFGSAGPAVAGGVLGAAAGWLVGIGSFVIPGVGPFIGAGAFLTSLAGAVAGAGLGALASGLVRMGVSESEARWYEEEVHEGRTLVAVRAPTRTAEARRLLRDSGAYDVEQRAEAVAGSPYRGIPD